MLAGFRSRWTIPRSCAASSASIIWREMWIVSSSGRPRDDPRRFASSLSASVSPSTSSRISAWMSPALLDAVNRADVRMIQRRQHARFTLEAAQAVRIPCE
jgi:hypothetical protein